MAELQVEMRAALRAASMAKKLDENTVYTKDLQMVATRAVSMVGG